MEKCELCSGPCCVGTLSCSPEPVRRDLPPTHNLVLFSSLKLSSAHLMGPPGVSPWTWGAGHPDLGGGAAVPFLSSRMSAVSSSSVLPGASVACLSTSSPCWLAGAPVGTSQERGPCGTPLLPPRHYANAPCPASPFDPAVYSLHIVLWILLKKILR